MFRNKVQHSIQTNQQNISTPNNLEDSFHSSSSDISLPLDQAGSSVANASENTTSTPRSAPNYCRRTASAKARVRCRSGQQGKARPLSAGSRPSTHSQDDPRVAVIDLVNKVIPDISDIERDRLLNFHESNHLKDFPYIEPMHFSKPQTNHFEFSPDENETKVKEAKKKAKEQSDLKPSIYGLQNKRHYYGSAPDLRCSGSSGDQFPYKYSDQFSEQQFTPQVMEYR